MNRIKRIVPTAVVLVLVAVGARRWLASRSGGDGTLTASGTVEATEAQLGFPTGGLLVRVVPQEGERVAAGTPLAWLDSAETVARRAQAAALADAARARLAELERGFRREEVEQARAAVSAARRRREEAELTFGRSERLLAGGAVSQEAFDQAELARDVALSEQQRTEEQLLLLERGPRAEQILAQRAALAQAVAQVAALDATLANLVVRAPFDGLVTVRHREPGEIVPAGSPVLTLLDLDDRWVRIYVPEPRLGAIALGASATITTDSYRDRRYGGTVRYIASEAEFTPKTVQTTEERVKLVYAVKVAVGDDPDHELKPGMPADVRVELPKHASR